MNISLLYILFPCLFCISQNVVCLFIGSLTVHQEYLILNLRYGLGRQPLPCGLSYVWKDWEVFGLVFYFLIQHTSAWLPGDLTNRNFSFFVIISLTFLLWTMYLNFSQRPIVSIFGWSKQWDFCCRSRWWKTHCQSAVSPSPCTGTNDSYESAGPTKDAAIITCFWLFLEPQNSY